MGTTAPAAPTLTVPIKSAAALTDYLPSGLTSHEARRRAAKSGPNAMPDTTLHPMRLALEKFWAPVPWMLQAAAVLEAVLGNYVQAGIIVSLVIFNAVRRWLMC